ncbi:hypothetical protein L484_014682 [Morus notabilis]|uniref:Pectinesterase catalytic domain-containing protein n=1 Tax=Morus notabilis TaxID=981085 RepID=W9T017_9ROSA|nr:hypothetical protein L484_014682 [Morus notabilis]
MQLKQRKVLTTSFNAIVAKDNTGDFTTVSEALRAAPRNNKTRYVIRVKPEIYKFDIHHFNRRRCSKNGHRISSFLIITSREISIL